jgi:hypothetical protein
MVAVNNLLFVCRLHSANDQAWLWQHSCLATAAWLWCRKAINKEQCIGKRCTVVCCNYKSWSTAVFTLQSIPCSGKIDMGLGCTDYRKVGRLTSIRLEFSQETFKLWFVCTCMTLIDEMVWSVVLLHSNYDMTLERHDNLAAVGPKVVTTTKYSQAIFTEQDKIPVVQFAHKLLRMLSKENKMRQPGWHCKTVPVCSLLFFKS